MRKILTVLVLGLALVGSCFAKEVELHDNDYFDKFNALSLTIENPIYITSIPEEKLSVCYTGESVDGEIFYNFIHYLYEEEFVTKENQVVRIIEKTIYDSDGSVTVWIYINAYEYDETGELIYSERLRSYFLQCYSLTTFSDEKSTIEYLQNHPNVRIVKREPID